MLRSYEKWLDELCSSNPLRIPRPKIDKLACQAQGVGIFAKGEITLRDAYCTYLIHRSKLLNYTPNQQFCQPVFQKWRSDIKQNQYSAQ
jgi:hypothetical protein